MNYNEIIQTFKNAEITVDEFAYEDYDMPELGEIEEVYAKGGEGEGEDWERVYYFKDHDVYISVKGAYASHYGCDFDDWDEAVSEVRPKEKTITVYE